MIVSEKPGEKGLLLVLAGRLDLQTSPPAQQQILSAIERGNKKLLLDLTDVTYVNSAGLRVFMIVAKKLKSVGGKIAICGINPNVHQVFDIAGFLPLIHIYSSKDEAYAALQ